MRVRAGLPNATQSHKLCLTTSIGDRPCRFHCSRGLGSNSQSGISRAADGKRCLVKHADDTTFVVLHRKLFSLQRVLPLAPVLLHARCARVALALSACGAQTRQLARWRHRRTRPAAADEEHSRETNCEELLLRKTLNFYSNFDDCIVAGGTTGSRG